MKKTLLILFLIACLPVFGQLPAYVPINGLMGFWPFSSNANDAGVNGNDGTVNGATLTADRFSTPNAAYSFDGLSNYIAVPSNSTLAGYNNLSISAWVNLGSLSNTQAIVAKWYQASCSGSSVNSDAYEMTTVGNHAQFATNNNNLGGFSAPPLLPSNTLNNWVHLVCTSSATHGQAIYINGILTATFAVTGNICNSINTLYFGADYNGSGQIFQHFLNGKLDDIGIWNRVLTPCEIQNLYTASAGGLVVTGAGSICAGVTVTLTAIGASTFTWNPGISSHSPTVVIVPSVSTVYTVTSDCSSILFPIVVTQTPALFANLTPDTVCAGGSVTLTASGANTYTWLGVGAGSSVVVNPLQQTTYTLVGAVGSCSSSLVMVEHVVPSPPLIVGPDTSVCLGGSVHLAVSGAQSYTWNPGGLTGSVVNVNPSVNTVYTVTGQSAGGCLSYATRAVFVSPLINVTAIATPSLVCPGQASTLTASGATSYTWLPLNITGTTAVVHPSISTIYTVTGTNGACASTATVQVNSGMQISATASGNLCNNSSVRLLVTSPAAATLASWSGPGIAGNPTTGSVYVNQVGIYTVVVTDTLSGCSGTTTVNVYGTNNPIPLSIIPSSSFACFPGSAVNMLVSAPLNLSWLPTGVVTPNTGPLVSVSPSVTSTYTVVGSLGLCTSSAVITISVNATPTLTATFPTTLCEGAAVTLSATGAASFNWFPGDLTGPAITVTPGTGSSYTLVGTNGNCSSSVLLPLAVFPVPQIQTSVTSATLCQGDTLNLSAWGAPLIAWLNSSPPLLSPTIAAAPTVSTIYTVTGTGSSGCQSSATIAVNVFNRVSISATSNATSICAGESLTLTASGAASYTWFPGLQVGNTIVTTPSASVVYTIFGDDAHCSSVDLPIVVNNCMDVSLGITNAAENPESWGIDLFKITFTVTANNASNSELQAIRLNDDLRATFISPISYTIINAPVITSRNSRLLINPFYDGSSELSLTSASSSTLAAAKRDTIQFTVLVDPKGFSGTLKNTVVGFGIDQNNVTATDSSNNGFEYDPDHDGDPTNNNKITPIEIEPVEFFISEGFSPDDDGINDLFIVKGLNGRKAKITIFNRWGNKVFFKEGTELFWDGKANVTYTLGHDKLPASTYYYIFEFTEGRSKIYHGFIVMSY